jgi:hypothetical protein
LIDEMKLWFSGSVNGLDERPAGSSVLDKCGVVGCLQFSFELPGKIPRLVAVQEPIGADAPAAQKPLPENVHNPRRPAFLDFFHGDDEITCCNGHDMSVRDGAECFQ